jgi:hypothetical protein
MCFGLPTFLASPQFPAVNAAVARYAANCSRCLPSINPKGNGANTAHQTTVATSTGTAPEFAKTGIADGKFGSGSGRSGIHSGPGSYSTQTFHLIPITRRSMFTSILLVQTSGAKLNIFLSFVVLRVVDQRENPASE